MSTEQTWQTNSSSSDNTLRIAGQIGRNLKGGEVIALVSDLGGGKTTFVRGLAQGLDSQDQVHSPSFTLSNQYRAKDLTLHHFDFYRLSEPGIMSRELAEVLEDPKSIVAIEWGNIVQDVLPDKHLSVEFKVDGDNSRQIFFKYPEDYDYLFPNNT